MREIKDVPQDTIASISCNGDILSACWNRSLSLHSSATCELKKQIRTRDPVLKTVFASRILTGDISGNVAVYDRCLSLVAETETGVGGIQLLHEHRGRVIAGGWDRKICFVGAGAGDTIATEKKVCCSGLREDILVVGQQEHVVAYDLRTNTPFFRRRFGMPIRSLAMADGGFFAGTTAGRIYYEDLADDAKSYVFNAHYSVAGNAKTFYPVNALEMHGDLFSGGSDGRVLRWRLGPKKTCKELAREDTGVSGMCLSGPSLVVAFSYCYDKGECSSRSKMAMLST